MGIGFAGESTQRGWGKWKRFVFFYLIAALMHSANDLGLMMVGVLVVAYVDALLRGIPLDFSSMGREPGPLWDGMRYGTYLYNIVLIIVLIVQTRRAFGLENTLQVEELSTEDSAVITAEELNQVKRERLFFKRKYKNFPKAIGAKLVLYQNLLAMQKHIATQLGLPLASVEPVAALRGAIQTLRAHSA